MNAGALHSQTVKRQNSKSVCSSRPVLEPLGPLCHWDQRGHWGQYWGHWGLTEFPQLQLFCCTCIVLVHFCLLYILWVTQGHDILGHSQPMTPLNTPLALVSGVWRFVTRVREGGVCGMEKAVPGYNTYCNQLLVSRHNSSIDIVACATLCQH